MQLCKGELKINYLPGRSYTLQVSAYQMGILLPFNNAPTLTFDELAQTTGLAPKALLSQLQLLCKAKLILESEKAYSLNMDFKSKKIRINLNVPIKSEQKAETAETHQTIEKDRELVIQVFYINKAAIVRIMKTRKAMQHKLLMMEVISQLQSRFKPSVPAIKKCIDILLEKEYIERMDDQNDMYSYVA